MNANPAMSRPYRSKTVKPCDACRRRRAACIRDKADDACSLCRHRGQSCTFMSAPQVRRGRPARDKRTVLTTSEERSAIEVPELEGSTAPNRDSCGEEAPISLTPGGWFDGTTMLLDRTCLYSGSSSDQDPHLLRHLVYDESECFGDDLWTVWRVGNQQAVPSYLTVFPNPHLDCHMDMYSQDKVESIFSPHQDELIRLYYTYVHPSYPILESHEILRSKRADKQIPSSLLAVIYYHGAQFWHLSDLAESDERPFQQDIRPWIFSCLNVEVRTPNLAVVQAILLFMQMMPSRIRAPNHPGFWPMTNMLVGIAQDIGLHVDPTNWNIVHSERKIRRILWWAVFTHDKWMSHSLGRPSHITSHNWNVAPLTLADFSDQNGNMPVETVSSANAFVSLCALSTILAGVLDTFYSIHSQFDKAPAEESLNKAQPLLEKLRHWEEESNVSTSEGYVHRYLVKLAGFSIRLSIQRALLGILATQQSTQANILSTEIVSTVRYSLFPVLDSLKKSRPDGLWLSYLKGNLAIVGSLLITLVLSSVEDKVLEERRAMLLEFRSYLKTFTELHADGACFEFARLPLRRLNLIIEELFGEDEMNIDLGSTPGYSEIGSEEALWASYQMSF